MIFKMARLTYLFIPTYFQYLFFPKCDIDNAQLLLFSAYLVSFSFIPFGIAFSIPIPIVLVFFHCRMIFSFIYKTY